MYLKFYWYMHAIYLAVNGHLLVVYGDNGFFVKKQAVFIEHSFNFQINVV